MSLTGEFKTLSTQQIAQIALSREMSKADLFAALQKAGLTREERKLIAAKLEEAGATGASTAATNTDTVSKGANTAATFSLSKALKGLWATIMAHPFLILAAAIAGIVTVANLAFETFDEGREKLEDLKGETGQAKNELQSLNDELETTRSRVEELQDKLDAGTITFVESEELSRLKEANDELARSIALKEADLRYKTRQQQDQFVKTMRTYTGAPMWQNANTAYADRTQADSDNQMFDDYSSSVSTLKERESELLAAQKQLELAATETEKKVAQAEVDRLQRAVQSWRDSVSSGESSLYEKYSQFRQMTDSLERIENPVTQTEIEYNDYYDFVQDWMDRYLILVDKSAGAKELAWKRITAIPDHKETVDALESLGKAGQVTADTLNNTEYSGFVANCQAAGISIEDLIGYFNAMQNAPGLDDKSVNSLKTALAGLSDETTILRTAMAKLGDGATAFDTWAKTGDNLTSLLDKFPDLRDELQSYADAVAAGEDPMRAFVELQNAMSAALNDIALDDTLDGIQNVVNAYEKYGANSNKVLQAVQNLERYVPGLTDVLYDENNALRANQESALKTVESLADLVLATKRSALELEKERLASLYKQLKAYQRSGIAEVALGDAPLDASALTTAIAEAKANIKEYEQFIASVNDWADGQEKESGKTESYVPEVDPLYGYLQAVEDINDALDRFDIDEKLLDEDDFEGKNQLIEKRVEKLEELKTALHALNDARDVEIAAAVEKLNGYGNFRATYDAESGQALIGNMGALKGLTDDTAKAAEKLISAIESGSKAAISTSNEYLNALAEQNKLLKEQKELQESNPDDQIERLKNSISWFENQQGVLEGSLYQTDALHKLKEQIGWLEEIQRVAHETAEAIRAAHPGIQDDDPLLQKWIQQWWDAEAQIKDKRREIVDATLAPIDEYIEKADNLNWWDNIDVTKVDLLRSKLELINGLLEDGTLTAAEFKKLNDDIAKQIYDEQINALETIIDKTKEMLKIEVEKRVEALESEVEDHEKITNSIKERLAALREEDNYNKSVAQKTKEIAELQQRINTLSLSQDRRDIAERKKLEEELAGLQGELSSTQAEHGYQAQVDALDKSHEAFEESKQDEIAAVKATIDTEGKLYAAAIKRIDEGWDKLYLDLIQINDTYMAGISGEDSITSAWKTATDAAKGYQGVLQAMQGIEKEYVTNVGNQNLVGGSDVNDPTAASHKLGAKAVDRYGMTVDQQEKLASIHAQMEANSGAWVTASDKRRLELHQENEGLAADADALLSKAGHRLVFNTADGEWYIDRIGGERFYDVYHKGGIVGSDEEFAKLQKGELVVPKDQVQTTMKLLEWGNSLASKMRGLFSGGGFVPSAMNGAIKGTPLSPAAGAIVNNTPSFAPHINVEVKYDSSASPADAKRFGEQVTAGITEAFRRKGIGAGANPLGVTI